MIKVGIERKGDENAENKGLVWVGKPANLASRDYTYMILSFSQTKICYGC